MRLWATRWRSGWICIVDSTCPRRFVSAAVKPYNPYFIEEPIQPHNVSALREVRERTGVPIAAGERIFTRWGFQQILEQRAADILNTDLAWTGGITEMKKIADYAQTHYIPMAPHNYGPLNCIALTHFMAVIPDTRHLEFTAYHYPTWNTYIDEPIEVTEGLMLWVGKKRYCRIEIDS